MNLLSIFVAYAIAIASIVLHMRQNIRLVEDGLDAISALAYGAAVFAIITGLFAVPGAVFGLLPLAFLLCVIFAIHTWRG